VRGSYTLFARARIPLRAYTFAAQNKGARLMSVQRKSVPASEADLESTAELPVLDVAAYEAGTTEERVSSTDTWVIPASAAAAMASAVVDEQRTHIEADLRALSANLREVEERLTRKGQRLIEIENELAESRSERAATEARAASLATELAEARDRAAAAEAQAAGTRNELELRIAGLRSEAEARHLEFSARLESQATEAQQAIASRDAAAGAQQARLQEMAAQLASRDRALVVASTEAREPGISRRSSRMKAGVACSSASSRLSTTHSKCAQRKRPARSRSCTHARTKFASSPRNSPHAINVPFRSRAS
jgi:hypothetical protein